MEKQILAAASYYKKSCFINTDDFPGLPTGVQAELRQLITEACEYVKGVVLLGFYPDGEIFLETAGDEADFDYDEIGARYFINTLIKEEEALFRSLSLWYIYTTTKGE